MTPRTGIGLALAVVIGSWTVPGAAQLRPLPEGAQSWSEMRVAGSEGVLTRNAWSARNGAGRRTSEVQITWLGADLRAAGAATRVHQGDTVLVSTSLRPGVAFVSMVHGGERPSVRMALARKGSQPVRVVDVPRQAGAGFDPVRTVSCATADGFAFLWQEASKTTAGDVKTYFATLREDGSWGQQPAEVAVPWGFGAMQWNGRGYHLALFYDGAAYGQTRLNFVTLSSAGQPEQHPWWISRPEAVGEVQLLATSTGMIAAWRGGTDETALHSTEVRGTGTWGTEAPAPRSHGTIDAGQMFALRLKADGTLDVVRRAQ
ncbi:MAG: hypothetical protein HY898_28570 [Deltaproteobacteria bacterium]|nr:hypothetical protein [Deltaproteobacteria bacterium]